MMALITELTCMEVKFGNVIVFGSQYEGVYPVKALNMIIDKAICGQWEMGITAINGLNSHHIGV